MGVRPVSEQFANRRILMRLALLVIVAASATACIFDQSDYKGGGRIGKGVTTKVPQDAAPDEPTDPTADAGVP